VSDKVPEFIDVAKPVLANPVVAPSEQIAGRTAQWDKFLGEVTDSYINILLLSFGQIPLPKVTIKDN
jgi:hypothetical protein